MSEDAFDRANLKDKGLEDHNKTVLKPWVEINPHNKKDYTVGFKLQIPLDKVISFFKNLFQKKTKKTVA